MSLRRRRPEGRSGDEIVELAALADGSLAPERRALLESRVAESPELAERLAEQERAVALVRIAEADVRAPATLRAGIGRQRHSRRVPSRRLAVIGVAAAAAAAAAVGIGVGVRGSGTAPERFAVSLGPTQLAPDARGEATLTKTSGGWRITLDATGLPRLANGRFYEAWLRNPAGVLVPVGTFNEPHRITLWAGVSPKEFTTLTVTRERADGDQTSSGEKVLSGAVGAGSS
jgi:Anti-sigma-K factor rskA